MKLLRVILINKGMGLMAVEEIKDNNDNTIKLEFNSEEALLEFEKELLLNQATVYEASIERLKKEQLECITKHKIDLEEYKLERYKAELEFNKSTRRMEIIVIGIITLLIAIIISLAVCFNNSTIEITSTSEAYNGEVAEDKVDKDNNSNVYKELDDEDNY